MEGRGLTLSELPEEIVVFDTEFTAWRGSQERKWSGPGEYREIIQIGAVRVETNTFQELDSFSVFVRPVKNSELSAYITHLTGITQKNIEENSVLFKEALSMFLSWVGGRSCYSYGGDEKVFEEDVTLYGLEPVAFTNFYNIQELFIAYGIPARSYMSSTIVRAFGVEPKLRGHDAVHDSRIIVEALSLLGARVEQISDSTVGQVIGIKEEE